jgi:hypothetical protein
MNVFCVRWAILPILIFTYVGPLFADSDIPGFSVSRLAKPVPDRPVQAVAKLKGEVLPVVAFDGDKPIAVVAGERKTLGRHTLSFRSAREQTPGLVTVQLLTEFPEMDSSLGPGVNHVRSLKAKFNADRDLSDVFALVVVYHTLDNIILTDTDTAVSGRAIGNLTAGQPVSMELVVPTLHWNEQLLIFHVRPPTSRWGLVLFSRGVQVRSSLGTNATDRVLDIADQQLFEAQLKQRLKGKHPVKLFRSWPLNFPDAIRQRYAGRTLQAQVTVSLTGTCEQVAFPENTDGELLKVADSQIRNWLFLPPFEDGLPIRSVVAIPVKF